MKQLKRGRKPKYKTEKQRKAAHNETVKRWQSRNPGYWKKKRNEKHNPNPAGASVYEARIARLKARYEEVLLTLEEVLKDNKKLSDQIKWGKR